MFLKNNINKEAVQSIENVSNQNKNIQQSNIPSINFRPNMSYYLLSKKNRYEKLVYSTKCLIDPTRVFTTKSERERYKRIINEFNSLRHKMNAEPSKAKLIAIAVIFQI